MAMGGRALWRLQKFMASDCIFDKFSLHSAGRGQEPHSDGVGNYDASIGEGKQGGASPAPTRCTFPTFFPPERGACGSG